MKKITALEKLRTKLDKIDHDMITLLKKRLKLSKKIGIQKKALNYKILQKNREKQAAALRLKLAEKYNISPNFVAKLFNIIVAKSRAEQSKTLDSET